MSPDPPSDLVRAVEKRLRADHAGVIEGIGDCADRVARGWDGESAPERVHVVDPLEACLSDRGVLGRFPDVLASAVEETGYALPSTPVAAPPYVVLTSRGPVLRATLEPGRLVVRFDAFAVVRAGGEVRYRRLDGVETDVSLERTP